MIVMIIIIIMGGKATAMKISITLKTTPPICGSIEAE